MDAIPRVSIINSPEIHGKSEHSQNDDISDGEPESADQKRLEDIVERDVTGMLFCVSFFGGVDYIIISCIILSSSF